MGPPPPLGWARRDGMTPRPARRTNGKPKAIRSSCGRRAAREMAVVDAWQRRRRQAPGRRRLRFQHRGADGQIAPPTLSDHREENARSRLEDAGWCAAIFGFVGVALGLGIAMLLWSGRDAVELLCR